jgi:hypothetical protein
MWRISKDSDGSGRIEVYGNGAYSDYATVCPSDENLTPVMMCSKAHVLTFYVDADESDDIGPGTEDNPVLMMDMDMDWPEDDDVPLVDNVEDLQVEYCLSGEDCSLDGSWIDEITYSEAPQVWMVRISMVVRSSREDPGGIRTSSRPQFANFTDAADEDDDGDHFYRQWMATEVTVRNMRYQAEL